MLKARKEALAIEREKEEERQVLEVKFNFAED